jgi:hypothetical protein
MSALSQKQTFSLSISRSLSAKSGQRLLRAQTIGFGRRRSQRGLPFFEIRPSLPSGLIHPVRPWGCQPCLRAARSASAMVGAKRYSTESVITELHSMKKGKPHAGGRQWGFPYCYSARLSLGERWTSPNSKTLTPEPGKKFPVLPARHCGQAISACPSSSSTRTQAPLGDAPYQLQG